MWGSQWVIDLCDRVFWLCLCGIRRKGGSEILIIVPFVSGCAMPCSVLSYFTCFRCLEWASWKFLKKTLITQSVWSCRIIWQKNVFCKKDLCLVIMLSLSTGFSNCRLETELKEVIGINGVILVLKQCHARRLARSTCLMPELGRSLGTTIQIQQSGC